MAKQPLRFKPGSKLKDYDPDFHGDHDKESARVEIARLHEKMQELQDKLYAESRQSLLITLQAMDTGGKDGAIKKVFEGINPQGVYVKAFKTPTLEELAHDFLWRVHPHVPAKGYISIFNRSHYEDVLVVRVNNFVAPEVWKKRYDQINDFERMLAESGTHILKFFLHISKEEQKLRLQERLSNPAKHWKFSSGDLPVREQWDAYMKAYQAVFDQCHTEIAPWYIVPANRKWYRDLVLAQVIVETLEAMNPRYPPPEAGLDKITIPD